MRTVHFAATQFACSWDIRANIEKAKYLVVEAIELGAQVVLLQELFQTPYFCQDQSPDHFKLAAPMEGNPLLAEMSTLAKELKVVLPVSFFERAGHAYFNSLAMIDADGRVLGLYRKTHIPAGPGYQEKYYFTPGDTGFRVFKTAYGTFGAGICWDQWFPECARSMALMGAEAIFFPTAIGSEPPPAPPFDSCDAWRRVMQGHAAANGVPVIASNRVGAEKGEAGELTFYGSSFITDAHGALAAEMDRTAEGVITASFDLDELATARASWGLYRDRRPEMYGALTRHG
ncbi:N-carbamoylputrescine amidase [Rhizomicrobium electricum]|jgi:N-carbamoylputrescine amidase|uniref:N-carbamoylputrescine amidase n=1 Tax=Rhizomicrobium electricum TaxID=480070 RepID=A0ABN1E112_9PROT|nr:N-carbamoylputrescine amidase [Rhizomicrobium electricum]NIJ47391.1 N-carbamoylputrescine amidase [Rhizomicrobium electricum]